MMNDPETGRLIPDIERFWRGDGWKPSTLHPFQCQHCYCLNTPDSSVRPLPHKKCCKCGDERVVSGTITFGG